MKCKKIFDGRQMPRRAKEQLRRAAVRRVGAGESPEAVAAGLGINRRTIYRWIEAFHYGGEPALKAKPIPGAPPKLDAKQMAKLARIVYTKNPLQLNFEFALWTLAMIRVLIRREFAISLSEVSVGRLMRRIGFSPQRPLYGAWQQDPALVERWRAEGIGLGDEEQVVAGAEPLGEVTPHGSLRSEAMLRRAANASPVPARNDSYRAGGESRADAFRLAWCFGTPLVTRDRASAVATRQKTPELPRTREES